MPTQPSEPPISKRQVASTRRQLQLDRERGVARTATATRWITVGGFAGMAVFAGLAATTTAGSASTPTTPPATEAPSTDAPSPSTAPPPTSPGTAPAPTAPIAPAAPGTEAPASAATTAPSTIAPAPRAPVQVPRNRHRTAATSGSS